MNIVNKLTLRQLKLNKRRTLVTILGVIISVAMVTAVMVSLSSATDLMKRVTISSRGNWHMRYHNMKAKDIDVLRNDENVEKIAISYPIGFSAIENPKNSDKPYLLIRGYNAEGFELLPIKLVEGRFPASSNEIVIPEHLEQGSGLMYQIGDKITLDLGERYVVNAATGERDEEALGMFESLARDEEGKRLETLVPLEEKEYTVVGISKKSKEEYSWSASYELITYISERDLPNEAKVMSSVFLKNLNRGIYEHNADLGMTLGLDVVEPHSELLACYGVNSDDSLIMALVGVVGIVLVIIVMGSVSLIYNAFAISVSERSQYLGMLASVGATKKQKKTSVLFEGVVIGGISIPLGLLAGFLGMWITFGAINGIFKNTMSIEEDLRLAVSPMAVMMSVLISIVTIFISTYLPAKRASKISPIEAIRQTTDIKMNKKKIKTSKLTRKVFGFEAELALKNLKRNGRRYRATLFSLVVSIILFLTTATFSAYMNRSLDMMVQSANYDVTVYANYRIDIAKRIELERLKDLEKVEKYSLLESTYSETYLSEEMTPEYIKSYLASDMTPEYLKGDLESGRDEQGYFYQVKIYGLEKDAFDAYAQSVGANLSAFENLKEPTAIVLNRTTFKDQTTDKYRDEEVIHANVNDKIMLSQREWPEGADKHNVVALGEIAIGGFGKEIPMGITIQDSNNTLNLLMPQDLFASLIESMNEKTEYKAYSNLSMYLTSEDPFGLERDIEALQEGSEYPTYVIHNIYEQKQTSQQMQLIMQVFIYGFIALITLVSIANIFNTISTSIALRKREFAMLRSVGMTPKGFNKMINFESIFYGIKALVYGLPISFIIMTVLYKQLSGSFEFDFFVPVGSIIVVIVSVFGIVGVSMFYSGAKVKGQNIIEGLKDSNL